MGEVDTSKFAFEPNHTGRGLAALMWIIHLRKVGTQCPAHAVGPAEPQLTSLFAAFGRFSSNAATSPLDRPWVSLTL